MNRAAARVAAAGLAAGVCLAAHAAAAQGTTSEAAVPFVYDAYAEVLAGYVDTNGMVNYAALKPRRHALEQFVRQLGALDPKRYETWNDQAKIAFWVNAYNGLTLKAVLDHYPIRAGWLRSFVYPKNSIRQIPGVWDELTFRVMGRNMTLGAIEHKRLRAGFNEPRIHVALVCAAVGCPPLRNEPYTGERLDGQLADQARQFLSNPATFRIDRSAGTVYLSSIFKWFGKDFTKRYAPKSGFGGHGEAERAVLGFIARYLPNAKAAFLREGTYDVTYLTYDWTLNEQR